MRLTNSFFFSVVNREAARRALKRDPAAERQWERLVSWYRDMRDHEKADNWPEFGDACARMLRRLDEVPLI